VVAGVADPPPHPFPLRRGMRWRRREKRLAEKTGGCASGCGELASRYLARSCPRCVFDLTWAARIVAAWAFDKCHAQLRQGIQAEKCVSLWDALHDEELHRAR
jgi:hypothetical protein